MACFQQRLIYFHWQRLNRSACAMSWTRTVLFCHSLCVSGPKGCISDLNTHNKKLTQRFNWMCVHFISAPVQLRNLPSSRTAGVTRARTSHNNYIMRLQLYVFVINTTSQSVLNRRIRESACICLFFEIFVLVGLLVVMLLLLLCCCCCCCFSD